MEVELFTGTTIAKISTDGGYVTNLADDNGDILFPKRTLTAPDGQHKIRGGSHICAPNFGPGGSSNQPQHGYARMGSWDIMEQTETQVVLSLAGSGEYEAVELKLTYSLAATEFTSVLEIINHSKHTVKAAPAFHPYFMINDEVELDGANQPNLSDYSEAVFKTGGKHILRTNGRFITLMSHTLKSWAIWTDQMASYLCVEPTHSGFSFEQDISKADDISAGQARTYDFAMQWSNLQ